MKKIGLLLTTTVVGIGLGGGVTVDSGLVVAGYMLLFGLGMCLLLDFNPFN